MENPKLTAREPSIDCHRSHSHVDQLTPGKNAVLANTHPRDQFVEANLRFGIV